MARPKLGDSDTERLHIKITSAEVDAIEQWRFANKVASKSEAVRQLCQVGLDADRELQGLARQSHEAYVSSTRILDSVVERNRPTSSDDFNEFVKKYLDTIKDLIELSREVGELAAKAQRASLRFRDKGESNPETEELLEKRA